MHATEIKIMIRPREYGDVLREGSGCREEYSWLLHCQTTKKLYKQQQQREHPEQFKELTHMPGIINITAFSLGFVFDAA